MFTTAPSDEFSIEIDGTEFRFWSGLEFVRSVDGVAAWSFAAPFEPDNQASREKWVPFRFQEAKLLAGGKPIAGGQVVNIVPEVSATEKIVKVSCQAAAGLWADLSPPDGTPLQFDGQKLDKIAKALGEPFGLTPTFGADAGAAFEKVALRVGEKVWPFLVGLAQQRGLIITSDADGQPQFYQTTAGAPVADIDGNLQPVTSVKFTPDGQQYFTAITGRAKAATGRAGGKFTASNPFAPSGVVRPMSYELDDTEPADTPAAVKAKLGRMFAAAATYQIELATALTPDGELYEPGDTIRLVAPDAMIYRPTIFQVRSVTVRATPQQTPTAALDIVLPGAFAGEVPTEEPWAP